MAKDLFRFKQFTIRQDRCAMKVTTLGCIQGSWMPKIKANQILDIGAGTGLLSLMVAQKCECEIDAVEIEKDAFDQLTDNVARSPWANRINCHHKDISLFAMSTKRTYDFIISNPPFFANQQRSPDAQINKARHDDSLTIKTLVELCSSLLYAQGKISVLLPPFETELLKKIATQFSLHISEQLAIYDAQEKPVKAIISILSRQQKKIKHHKLVMKQSNGRYSADFTALLKDYYLNL